MGHSKSTEPMEQRKHTPATGHVGLLWYTRLGREVGDGGPKGRRDEEAVALSSLITLRYQSHYHCRLHDTGYTQLYKEQLGRLIMVSCCGDYLFQRSSMGFAAVNVVQHVQRTVFNAGGQETSLARKEIAVASDNSLDHSSPHART